MHFSPLHGKVMPAGVWAAASQLRRDAGRPLPQAGTGRTVEVRTVVVPPIPLVDARQRFLSGLRFKTSRVSNRRLTAGTAEKYRHRLNRFERWLIASGLPLDLALLTELDMADLQTAILDDLDDGSLQESSANTYTRCIKTLFADTWQQLALEPSTNPALHLHAGSQQAVDFPLFKPEHVRALLKAAVRPRTRNITDWVRYRDQAMLARFFDLGWRVGEASKAQLDDVDLLAGLVTVPRENAKTRRARMIGLNPETGRLLKTWIERWRPSVPNQYLFVSDDGGRYQPGSIRQMFRRLARASGIPREAARVSPHTCRHYFAVQWARHHRRTWPACCGCWDTRLCRRHRSTSSGLMISGRSNGSRACHQTGAEIGIA